MSSANGVWGRAPAEKNWCILAAKIRHPVATILIINHCFCSITWPTTPELRRYTTLWNNNVSKTNKLQSVRADSDFLDTSESSDSDRCTWSVRHWILLDLSVWIPDVLNDVFVTGLPGLVPVYQQWSVVTFSSVLACFGLTLCRCFLFPESFSVNC